MRDFSPVSKTLLTKCNSRRLLYVIGVDGLEPIKPRESLMLEFWCDLSSR
jgi:hypothetical protein